MSAIAARRNLIPPSVARRPQRQHLDCRIAREAALNRRQGFGPRQPNALGVPDATLPPYSADPAPGRRGLDTELTLTLTAGGVVRAALTSSLILGRRDHECVAEADMDEHRARLDALRTRPHTAWGERCATRTMPERPRRGRATPGHFQKPRRRRRSTSQKQGRIPGKRRLTGCAGLVDS